MIVEKDDETQISGAMNGRHADSNPSDGLFKPTHRNVTRVLMDCNRYYRNNLYVLSGLVVSTKAPKGPRGETFAPQ